jgi:hypothetical protein
LWQRGTPNNDIRNSANHRTSDEEAENVDAILPRSDPIPGTFHRVTLKDNYKNGGNEAEHHQATKKQHDSAENLAGKKPMIGRDDGAFDESAGSEVAEAANIKRYAYTQRDDVRGGRLRVDTKVPDMLSQALSCGKEAARREDYCRHRSCGCEVLRAS